MFLTGESKTELRGGGAVCEPLKWWSCVCLWVLWGEAYPVLGNIGRRSCPSPQEPTNLITLTGPGPTDVGVTATSATSREHQEVGHRRPRDQWPIISQYRKRWTRADNTPDEHCRLTHKLTSEAIDKMLTVSHTRKILKIQNVATGSLKCVEPFVFFFL